MIGTDAELEAYIRSFDRSLGAPNTQLGEAPPSRLYASPATLDAHKAIADKLMNVPSKEAMEALNKELRDFTRPVANLIGTAS